jgi:hypothetical protein
MRKVDSADEPDRSPGSKGLAARDRALATATDTLSRALRGRGISIPLVGADSGACYVGRIIAGGMNDEPPRITGAAGRP